ncbi:hypothetical protein Tco_1251105, partial [Tanacetum coccineum]
DTVTALHDVEEEEKELMVKVHSEKLAIAFGLLNTENGRMLIDFIILKMANVLVGIIGEAPSIPLCKGTEISFIFSVHRVAPFIQCLLFLFTAKGVKESSLQLTVLKGETGADVSASDWSACNIFVLSGADQSFADKSGSNTSVLVPSLSCAPGAHIKKKMKILLFNIICHIFDNLLDNK